MDILAAHGRSGVFYRVHRRDHQIARRGAKTARSRPGGIVIRGNPAVNRVAAAPKQERQPDCRLERTAGYRRRAGQNDQYQQQTSQHNLFKHETAYFSVQW